MLFEKQIVNIFRNTAYKRCDGDGTAFYFSAADFAGLSAERFEFSSSLGHTLVGALYSYEGYRPDRLVIFDHGFGGGHRSYMKEIERLCRGGYRVLAYDHTGCMESGGENTNGMAQSLRDLNDCLLAVKADERLAGLDISVMGHSWGGFSTLNISSLHPEISHVVVLSGFVSGEEIVASFFGGIMKPYRKAVMKLERETNPYFSTFSATESLKNTRAKCLLIYSENDKLVPRHHFDLLSEALSENENVELLLVSGKGHNPNYTVDAVAYLGEYLSSRARLRKKKKLATDEEKASFLASFDWHRMTEQDEEIFAKIFACLES